MPFFAPLEMPPGLVFNSRTFDLGHAQGISPGGKGFLQTVDRAAPMWFAEYKTPPLRPSRYDETIGFLRQLEGSSQSFLAYDPRRIMPRAYQSQPVTATPWHDNGTEDPLLVSFDFTAGTINVRNFNGGSIITTGDYLSTLVGKKWYLFQAVETLVTPDDTAFDLKVRPRPQIEGLTTPTVIRYRRAVAQMKILGGFKEDDSVDQIGPSISFRAAQFIDRTP